jgi:hypothetical protein
VDAESAPTGIDVTSGGRVVFRHASRATHRSRSRALVVAMGITKAKELVAEVESKLAAVIEGSSSRRRARRLNESIHPSPRGSTSVSRDQVCSVGPTTLNRAPLPTRYVTGCLRVGSTRHVSRIMFTPAPCFG